MSVVEARPLAPRDVKRERVRSELGRVLGDVLGPLLEHPDVQEVDVNEDGIAWVDWAGENPGRRPVEGFELSYNAGEEIAIAIVADAGGVLNEENDDIVVKVPLLGKEFVRMSIHAPPAVERYTFAARKHTGLAGDLRKMIAAGEMHDEHFAAIVESQQRRDNGVIAGEMFAGKTTLHNGILRIVADVDPTRRYGYVETVPEVVSPIRNSYGVRTTKYKSERDRIRELMTRNLNSVSNAETKSASAWDLLDAWNTHKGGHTTTHAGTIVGALRRIKTLALSAQMGDVSDEFIADVVNFVAVLGFRHGLGRKVLEVGRVLGVRADGTFEIEYIGPRHRAGLSGYELIAA